MSGINPWHIPERVHSVTSAPYLNGGMNSSFPQCKSALNLYWRNTKRVIWYNIRETIPMHVITIGSIIALNAYSEDLWIFVNIRSCWTWKSFKILALWEDHSFKRQWNNICDLEPDSVSRCEPIFGQFSHILGSTTEMCSKMYILHLEK